MSRTNPPWSDRILKKHWAALESRVGAKWMPIAATEHPKLAKLKEDLDYADARIAKGEQIAWREDVARRYEALARKKPKGYREYGSGHYGCVMPTPTAGVVIKVTTDQTEAAFVAAYLSLAPSQRPVGIIPYHKIIAIRSESHLKRPVFVLWRDEAEYVGKIGEWIAEQARDFEKDYYRRSWEKARRSLGNCLDAARGIRQRVRKRADAKQVLADAVSQMGDAWNAGARTQLPLHNFKNRTKAVAWLLAVFDANAQEMTTEPMGNYIGQALHESLEAGLLLADVHLGNVGIPVGALADEIGKTPIITDPGHAIALDDRYAGVQVEEL